MGHFIRNIYLILDGTNLIGERGAGFGVGGTNLPKKVADSGAIPEFQM